MCLYDSSTIQACPDVSDLSIKDEELYPNLDDPAATSTPICRSPVSKHISTTAVHRSSPNVIGSSTQYSLVISEFPDALHASFRIASPYLSPKLPSKSTASLNIPSLTNAADPTDFIFLKISQAHRREIPLYVFAILRQHEVSLPFMIAPWLESEVQEPIKSITNLVINFMEAIEYIESE